MFCWLSTHRMPHLRQYSRHVVGHHVVDEGNECAGARVDDRVSIGWRLSDLLHEVVKASWIKCGDLSLKAR
jgi:hypothetical protein